MLYFEKNNAFMLWLIFVLICQYELHSLGATTLKQTLIQNASLKGQLCFL